MKFLFFKFIIASSWRLKRLVDCWNLSTSLENQNFRSFFARQTVPPSFVRENVLAWKNVFEVFLARTKIYWICSVKDIVLRNKSAKCWLTQQIRLPLMSNKKWCTPHWTGNFVLGKNRQSRTYHHNTVKIKLTILPMYRLIMAVLIQKQKLWLWLVYPEVLSFISINFLEKCSFLKRSTG